MKYRCAGIILIMKEVQRNCFSPCQGGSFAEPQLHTLRTSINPLSNCRMILSINLVLVFLPIYSCYLLYLLSISIYLSIYLSIYYYLSIHLSIYYLVSKPSFQLEGDTAIRGPRYWACVASFQLIFIIIHSKVLFPPLAVWYEISLPK